MKLKLSCDNIDITLTNAKGEPIYTYQADSLNEELDVAKLIEAVVEIQQMIFAAIEKASAEPTPTASQEA